MTNTIRQDVNILGTLSAQGITPELASVILNNVYKVGAIYISTDSTSPASIYGGTWERIQDKFLLASGDTYTGGTTGGSATHTLTIDELPTHAHIQQATDSPAGWAYNQVYQITNPSYTEFAGQGVGTSGTVYSSANNYGNYVRTLPVGEGKAHNNMPPYLAVYVWKKLED